MHRTHFAFLRFGVSKTPSETSAARICVENSAIGFNSVFILGYGRGCFKTGAKLNFIFLIENFLMSRFKSFYMFHSLVM